MKIKKNSAFTLIETMVALVISVISVAAIYNAYLFFNNSYQGLLDKASISNAGRTSLSIVAKDLRNAGYKDINFGRAFDRWIEQTDNYNNTGADSLVIWYNTSPTERLRIRYFLKKYSTGSDMFLAREVVENPTNGPMLRYCERYSSQKNCEPQNIVPFVTDFQIVFKDANGNELRPVCADKVTVPKAAPSTPGCSAAGKAKQSEVHTAEIYLTVRSPNQIYKKNKIIEILNYNSSTGKKKTITDRYHRETFFISVYLRNIVKI